MPIFKDRLRAAPTHGSHREPPIGSRLSGRTGPWILSAVAAVVVVASLWTLSSSVPPRDYFEETPVGPAQYETFARLYDYDSLQLDAALETADTATGWIAQRVSFTAAYDSERMAAYVYVPRNVRPPFQVVVCWPGGLALRIHALDTQAFGEAFAFVMESGRAFVLPVFKGTFDRDDYLNPIESLPAWPNRARDLTIQWVMNLRRTLDYLESRPDMNRERLAYYGWSWGGLMLPVALAVEPRFKVGISDEGGMTRRRSPPEADPFHFLSRVASPVLMLNGRNSQVFPYEEAQLPMFELLGTPPEHKRHITYDAGHSIDNSLLSADMLAWLDMYLGPVEGF